MVAVVTVAATAASAMFAWILITASPEPAPATAEPTPATAEDQEVTNLERSVQQNLAAWQSEAVNLVTGELLGNVDFTTDVVVINNAVAAVPTPWMFGPYRSATTPTPAGTMDVEWAESTQPFRARELIDSNGAPVADVFVFAGVSDNGLNYLRQAVNRWNPNLSADDPNLGRTVMLTPVTPPQDGLSGGTWFASLTDNVSVLIGVAPGFIQHDLIDFLIGWRASLTGP